MKATFKSGGVQFEADVGNMEASMLLALWTASVKHGAHVQIAVTLSNGRASFVNIRCLSDETFEGMLIPSRTLPPPSFIPAGGSRPPDG